MEIRRLYGSRHRGAVEFKGGEHTEEQKAVAAKRFRDAIRYVNSGFELAGELYR
jgi:hypothetical protein